MTGRISCKSRQLTAAALLAGLVLVAMPATTHAQSGEGGGPRSVEAEGFPTYLRGTVVNQATGNPVRGVLVTLRDPVTRVVIAADTTNVHGVYRFDGLDSDEYGVKFNGTRKGYESGFLACGHDVVATWGEACTFAPGPVGRARLERL